MTDPASAESRHSSRAAARSDVIPEENRPRRTLTAMDARTRRLLVLAALALLLVAVAVGPLLR